MLRVRAHPFTNFPVLCDADGVALPQQTRCELRSDAHGQSIVVELRYEPNGRVVIEMEKKADTGR